MMSRSPIRTSSSSSSPPSSAGSDAGAEIAPADPTPSPSPRPATWRRRISSAPDAGDARELWQRMLELQQRYGCYRSARMQAAVSDARAADMTPSRACLDLLNDDVADELPDEAWHILGRFAVERAFREGGRESFSKR